MSSYLIVLVVLLAGLALLWLGGWSSRRGGARLVRNAEVDLRLLYQPLAAGVAVLTVLAAALLSDDPWAYLQPGNLAAPVTGLGWLGVSTSDTWLTIGLTMGAIITAVTTVVVVLQARSSGRLRLRAVPLALALSLPFSLVNAATEEAIFRLAPVTALSGIASMTTIAILSAALFGLPHYFGHPGKVPGVILAAFLGWIACLSMLQTQGWLWAVAVHFVQDVVILTVLFAVAAGKRNAAPAGADGGQPAGANGGEPAVSGTPAAPTP